MSLSTTYSNGALTLSATQVTLAAYTAPAGGQTLGQHVQLQWATGETCLVTDDTLAPTLSVVRGYAGTQAAAHSLYEGVVYGNVADAAWPSSPARQLGQPVISMQTQEITATGATGSTAGVVTPASFGFIQSTGVTGTGINLPVPTVGNTYVIRNNSTGDLIIYSVGATVNGVTGTTGATLTATGNKTAWALCSTAGVWRVTGNT